MKQLAKELATNPDAPIAWGILGIVILIGAYAMWAAIKGKATHYLIAQIVLSSVSLIFRVGKDRLASRSAEVSNLWI